MKKSRLMKAVIIIIASTSVYPLIAQAQSPKALAPNYGDFLPNTLSNNNIGIGTLPQSTGKLTLLADAHWWDYLRMIPIGKVNEGYWLFHNPEDQDKLHIGWHTINPSKEFWNLTLTRDAKVGINSISPVAQLDVNGTVLIHSGDDNYMAIGERTLLFGSGTFKITAYFNGKVFANEIEVNNNSWPDYVFTPDYKMLTLSELEAYVNRYSHLPGIPSAETVSKEGINLGEMDGLLLQKVEELTLYVIELKKEIEELKAKQGNSSNLK